MASKGRALSEEANPPDLHIEQDLPFQYRTWVIQRIGWGLMSLFLAAAVAGLFSSGPLSSATAHDPANLVVLEYQRFARYMAPTKLVVRLQPSATAQDNVSIRASYALIEGWQIEHIRPEPEHMAVASDGLHLAFKLAEKGKPVEIAFLLKPQGIGGLQGAIGLPGREPAQVSQFVYP